MAQQLQLVVGGTNLTQYLVQDGWSIAQNWSRQGDTASFELADEHPTVNALTFTVQPLATVTLSDLAIGQTLFSGVVPKPQFKRDGPTLARWHLDCVDWTYLADRTLVAGDYANYGADALAVLLTTVANCGLNAALTSAGGYVNPAPVIPRVQFNWITLTQAWTRLSKLASPTLTWGWYVDENRNLHFYDTTQAPSSGWTFSDDTAKVGVAGYSTYLADDYAYEWDATSIRNVVTVRGADYSANQTDLFVGNGSTTAFALTFTPDSTNIGTAVLTVGGVPATVSAETGTSATTDYVIVANTANQWFLQCNNAAAPGALLVSFTYPYLQPVVSQISDTGSIGQFASLPNGGKFQYYIGDSNLPTLLAAQKRALREVATYSLPTERVQLTLDQGFTGHVRAGQLIQVVNSVTPDSQRSYASGINASFIVLQNRIDGSPGNFRTYQITAARVS